MYTMLNNAMAYMVMSIVKDIENWKEIAINSIGIAKFVLDTYLGSDHFLSKLCVFLHKSIEELGGKLHYSIPTINGVLSRCCDGLIRFVYSKEQTPLHKDNKDHLLKDHLLKEENVRGGYLHVNLVANNSKLIFDDEQCHFE